MTIQMLTCSIPDETTAMEGASPAHVCLQDKAAEVPAERAILTRRVFPCLQVKKLYCLHETAASELPRIVWAKGNPPTCHAISRI